MKRSHILILGGARSGKSRYALQLAERRWRRPLYLATAEVLDAEMAARVKAHREARGKRWRCVEEPLEIAKVIQGAPSTMKRDGLLVDCLTLWLSNVLLKEGETAVGIRQKELLAALCRAPQDVILVSNEVGLGVVPEHQLGRIFRDCAGRLNQELAAAVDTVVLVAAGLPLIMKGHLPK